ncbi:phage tail protein [Trinickia sp. Y13]|uniref:phage tail protein n=1 Tax=Trinickia sp. Y13 TaxID=2917807 RepID=UPI002406C588|nr:phage tail protein [Trinickia sp. Y13]MDG0025139.1 phage tail protein [Trinickia sp. Y13]
MSAPESSSSKGRPSLLSETAPGSVDNNSRILASLEGRVVAQQPPRRRSKKPVLAVGAAVVAFSALGAWQWLRGQQNDVSVATAAPAATVAAKASPASGAATGAASSVQVAQVAAASAPQAAVIVADDTVRGDDASASAGASSPRGADADRLSQALASGAAPVQNGDKPVSAAVAAAATSAPAAQQQAPVKTMAARTQRESAKQNPRESAKTRHAERLAGAHARKHVKGRSRAVKDDPDVDLLAALVARTKPYDAKPAKAASAPVGASKAAASKAGAASLADQVKACDNGNFFEVQRCRWRACSGHWGKDPACPSTAAAAQAQQQAQSR